MSVPSLDVWFTDGGPFVGPLVVVGLAGLAVLMDRVRHIVMGTRIHARPFMERVIDLTRSGKVDDAVALCAAHQSALPDLGLVILRNREAGEMALRSAARAVLLRVVPALRRRLAWLRALAVIALLVGALGASANLHDALPGMRLDAAIRYALRPLGVGLLLSIPLLAGHVWLASEVERIVSQLEEFSARLIDAVIDHPDVRLGHRA